MCFVFVVAGVHADGAEDVHAVPGVAARVQSGGRRAGNDRRRHDG